MLFLPGKKSEIQEMEIWNEIQELEIIYIYRFCMILLWFSSIPVL